jgi:hypothetical protein
LTKRLKGHRLAGADDASHNRPEGIGSVTAGRLVPLAAVILAMTGPGQTATISAFVQPLSRDLGVDASVVSTAYLVGTLAGAVTMPWWDG